MPPFFNLAPKETKRKSRVITPKRFEAWLARQKASRVFDFCNNGTCAFASFLKEEMGYSWVFVTAFAFKYKHGVESRPIPPWICHVLLWNVKEVFTVAELRRAYNRAKALDRVFNRG